LELGTDPLVQARVDLLAERANEGLLTPEERAEYETYINADDFIAILKMKAERYVVSDWASHPAAGGPDSALLQARMRVRSRISN